MDDKHIPQIIDEEPEELDEGTAAKQESELVDGLATEHTAGAFFVTQNVSGDLQHAQDTEETGQVFIVDDAYEEPQVAEGELAVDALGEELFPEHVADEELPELILTAEELTPEYVEIIDDTALDDTLDTVMGGVSERPAPSSDSADGIPSLNDEPAVSDEGMDFVQPDEGTSAASLAVASRPLISRILADDEDGAPEDAGYMAASLADVDRDVRTEPLGEELLTLELEADDSSVSVTEGLDEYSSTPSDPEGQVLADDFGGDDSFEGLQEELAKAYAFDSSPFDIATDEADEAKGLEHLRVGGMAENQEDDAPSVELPRGEQSNHGTVDETQEDEQPTEGAESSEEPLAESAVTFSKTDAEHTETDTEDSASEDDIPAQPVDLSSQPSEKTVTWPVESVSSYPTFMFHDGGERGYLFSKKEFTPLDDIALAPKFCRLFVEYNDSPGLGVMSIHGDVKYADVLARKQLEERGELTADGHLIVYSKRKGRSGAESAVLYQVVPRQQYTSYVAAYSRSPKGFVGFDTVSSLAAVLGQSKGVKTIAIRLPEGVLMMSAENGKVLQARRYTLLGEDMQALNDLVYTIMRDLEDVRVATGRMPEHVEWYDALISNPEWSIPRTDVPVVRMPLMPFEGTFGTIWSSLPALMKKVPDTSALMNKRELLVSSLERMEKFLWLFLLVGIVAFAVPGFQKYGRIGMLESQIAQTKDAISRHEQALYDVEPVPVEMLGKMLPAAALIRDASGAPTPVDIWNDIAREKPASMQVDALEVNISPAKYTVYLRGRIPTGTVKAQGDLAQFMADMDASGYSSASHTLDLGHGSNSFAIELVKTVQGR